jgi:hypothetical protein
MPGLAITQQVAFQQAQYLLAMATSHAAQFAASLR